MPDFKDVYEFYEKLKKCWGIFIIGKVYINIIEYNIVVVVDTLIFVYGV